MKNLFLSLIITAVFGSSAARAGTLWVTSTADSGGGSLRGALGAVRDGDLIELAVGGTIRLTSGELRVSNNIGIVGPGGSYLAVDGNHAGRVFYIAPGKTVWITGLTITNGNALDGGGVYNDRATLRIQFCTLSGNSATFTGGGIYNDGRSGSASLEIVNSTFSGNSATYEGGGIQNEVAVEGSSASLTVMNSTLSGNSAYNGGGIRNVGVRGSASLQMVNSTLSGNSALIGGGIDNIGVEGGSRSLELVNSTLSGNSAAITVKGGGIRNYAEAGSAMVEIGNTILNGGGAMGPNLGNEGGAVFSLGYNLSNDAANGDGTTGPGGFLNAAGDIRNTDPLLGRLQDNGGWTFTHALLPGSPAIDAGDPVNARADTDQRDFGYPRVVNGRIDIGAFEAPLFTPTITTATAAAVQYSDWVTLHAAVSPDTATGSIQFSVDDTPVGSPVAVSGGVAELNVQVLLARGTHSIKAEYTGDTVYNRSEGTSTLTVTRENATVAPRSSNPLAVKVNTVGGTAGPITLWADITEVADDSLGNIINAVPVTFTLVPVAGGASITQTILSVSAFNGALSVCATFTSVPVNVYDITISVGGDYYTGSAETCLAVYDPSLGSVTGGGNVTHDGVPADFVFGVKYLKNGQPQGSLLYIQHGPAGPVALKSNSLSSLAIVGNTAVITGKATVDGVGNYGFRATAVDNGDSGTTDQFGLKVTDPTGAVVGNLTFDPLAVTRGDIQVPQAKKK